MRIRKRLVIVRGAPRVHRNLPWTFGELAYFTQLTVMMLHTLAQLFAFTRFPFMSGKVSKTSVSLETSSQTRNVRGYRLRHLMLKMSVSPETSSENGDVQIAGVICGSPKMGVSPETSAKNWMSKELF